MVMNKYISNILIDLSVIISSQLVISCAMIVKILYLPYWHVILIRKEEIQTIPFHNAFLIWNAEFFKDHIYLGFFGVIALFLRMRLKNGITIESKYRAIVYFLVALILNIANTNHVARMLY